MITALERLAHINAPPGQLAAFRISGGVGRGLARLFTSDPPIAQRIAALRAAQLSA
jgi:heat shock protein HtpX